MKIIIDGIIISDNYIVKDEITYKLPDGCNSGNVRKFRDKLIIDGYEFKDGEFYKVD